MGLGVSHELASGRRYHAAGAQLFEDALVLSPANPKALLYGGFAAAVRGVARARALALASTQGFESAAADRANAGCAHRRAGATGGQSHCGRHADTASAGTSTSPAGTNASAEASNGSGSHRQYQHRTRPEITIGIGGPPVRLCT